MTSVVPTGTDQVTGQNRQLESNDTLATASGIALGLQILSTQFQGSGTNMGFTVPANTLSNNGDWLLIVAWGNAAGAAPNVTMSFGGTNIVDINLGAAEAIWLGFVMRVDGTNQSAGATILPFNANSFTKFTTPAETLSSAVDIDVDSPTGSVRALIVLKGPASS